MLYIRVRIIASHFVNCKVNSSYCDCKLVNNTKIAKQLFSKGKFNSLELYFSALYPYFIHPLHIIIKRNIFIPKITPQNAKKASQFLNIFKKHFWLWRGKSLTTLGLFIAKRISSDNLNAVQNGLEKYMSFTINISLVLLTA